MTLSPHQNSASPAWRGYVDGWGMRRTGGKNGRRRRVYLAKLDLQNACWSIELPAAWEQIFLVEGRSGRRYRYLRLPFGWSYNPAICQPLVTAVIRQVMDRKGVRGWVYLDDIVVVN